MPNFDSAPFSMPKLEPVNHFSQVNSLDPGLKLLESGICCHSVATNTENTK